MQDNENIKKPESTNERHHCRAALNYNNGSINCWGPAVEDCSEDEHGRFVVYGEEYKSEVFFCPFCGAKAPTSPRCGGGAIYHQRNGTDLERDVGECQHCHGKDVPEVHHD